MKKIYSKPASASVSMTTVEMLSTSKVSSNNTGGNYYNALDKKPEGWAVSKDGEWGE